jgi:hypothetical protein
VAEEIDGNCECQKEKEKEEEDPGIETGEVDIGELSIQLIVEREEKHGWWGRIPTEKQFRVRDLGGQ